MNNFIAGHRIQPVQVLAVSAVMLALVGCNADDIKVYKVAKQHSATPDPMAFSSLSSQEMAQPKLKWVTPQGWEELKPSDMRVASFRVKGQGGKDADMSVVPLGGMAGGDLPNVNRWRKEVGLADATGEELPKLAEKVAIGADEADIYDQSGVNAGSGDKERILAAILHRDGTTWFFKMKGDDELVSGQKKNFVEFLKSLSFGSSETMAAMPSDHPTIGGEMSGLPPDHPAIGGDLSGMQLADESSSLPKWTVPGTWKQEPPTQMLLAKFSAGGESARADITISSFPGDVGGAVANVNRWRRQVGLPALDDAAAQGSLKEISVQSEKGSLLDVEGKSASSGKPTRLIGVMLPHQGQTWFFKMMGDANVVAGQKDAFVKFVESVKF